MNTSYGYEIETHDILFTQGNSSFFNKNENLFTLDHWNVTPDTINDLSKQLGVLFFNKEDVICQNLEFVSEKYVNTKSIISQFNPVELFLENLLKKKNECRKRRMEIIYSAI